MKNQLFVIVFVLINILICNQSYSFHLNINNKSLSFNKLLKSIAINLTITQLLFINKSNAIEYIAPDQSYSFKYTEDFTISPKLLKTHDQEVFLKSNSIKGLSIGLSVDKIKLNNIKDFTTPKGLADKVAKVELSKDGVFDVNVVNYNEVNKNPIQYYTEYVVDSSRGKNHYAINSAIYNRNLFVLTIQSKEDDFKSIEKLAHEVLDSFDIKVDI